MVALNIRMGGDVREGRKICDVCLHVSLREKVSPWAEMRLFLKNQHRGLVQKHTGNGTQVQCRVKVRILELGGYYMIVYFRADHYCGKSKKVYRSGILRKRRKSFQTCQN